VKMSPFISRQHRTRGFHFVIVICTFVLSLHIVSLWWLPEDELAQTSGKPNSQLRYVLRNIAGGRKLSDDAVRMFSNTSFNQVSIDTRSPKCKNTLYDIFSLPKTSVIIFVNNETFPMFMGTIFTLAHRTPWEILHEIVIICDVTVPKLSSYILKEIFPRTNITVYHALWSMGTTTARVVGAKRASGDVIVFLDMNTRVNHGWLEPILSEIKLNRNTIVQPSIDVMNSKTLKYQRYNDEMKGVISWNLEFKYARVLKDRRNPLNETESLSTSAISGEVFAVNRMYFFEIGGLDTSMRSGGGENIELSIRVWLCGGNMKILPCSRVTQYIWKETSVKGNNSNRLSNNQRIAETWLGNHRRYFYFANDGRVIPSTESYANSEMKRIKSKLQCKDFNWFIRYVSPLLSVPLTLNSKLYYGKLQNLKSLQCVGIDESEKLNSDRIRLHMKPCLSEESKYFVFGQNRLLFNGFCALFDEDRYAILSPCSKVPDEHTWDYNEEQQLYWSFIDGGCAMHVTDPDEESNSRQTVMLMQCNHDQLMFSKWKFQFEIS